MVSYVLLMEISNKKADLRFVLMTYGGISVPTHGIPLMHIFFAKHLDMMAQVSIYNYIYIYIYIYIYM